MTCLGGPTKFYYDDSGNLIGMRQNYDQPIKFQVNYATGEIDGFTQGSNTYWYRKNQQGDVTGIFNTAYGNTALFVEYEYDAWGNIISITGDGASTIGQTNPIRYRGYFYDTETGYYYLNSRYYDPVTHRFLNGDTYADTGQGILGTNMFAYCLNNPVAYGDPTGMIVKTVICNDGGGGVSSVEKEKQREEKLKEELPEKGVSVALGVAIVASTPSPEASLVGRTGTYSELRRLTAGTGLEVHHLIEQRFFYHGVMPTHHKGKDTPCVILDPATHQGFTNAWRNKYGYGKSYDGIDSNSVINTAKDIYGAYDDWVDLIDMVYN